MKKCNKCGIEKELSEFHKNKGYKDGHESKCKQCIRQYEIDNKDKIRERKQNYYVENKQCINLRNNNWQAKNKDKVKLLNKTNREKNLEKTLIRNKKYNDSNALFTIYSHQLTMDEEPRLSEDSISLEVKCKHCRTYFIPNNNGN